MIRIYSSSFIIIIIHSPLLQCPLFGILLFSQRQDHQMKVLAWNDGFSHKSGIFKSIDPSQHCQNERISSVSSIRQQRWIFHTVMDRLFRTLEEKMATEWTLDQTLYEKGNSKGVFCRLFGRRSKDSRESLWQWTTEILLNSVRVCKMWPVL